MSFQANTVAAEGRAISVVPTRRFASLDGIRGMAILMVVFGHFVGSLGLLGRYSVYDQYFFSTPLHIFFNETDAVIIFFVLSGYVMQVPLSSPEFEVKYIPFWGQRFFRLYPVHVVGLAFAILVHYFIINNEMISLFNSQLVIFSSYIPSIDDLKRELNPLLPGLHTSKINAPLWSLFVEAKISFIFPIIAICAKKLRKSEFLIISMAIWYLCVNSQYQTMQYVPMFLLGVFGAQHHEYLKKYVPLNKYSQMIALILLLCAFEMRFMTGRISYLADNNFSQYSYHSLTALATIALIVLSLCDGPAKKIFSNQILTKFGRITYPLYVIHFPVYLASISLFGKIFSRRVEVFVASATATLVVSLLLTYALHTIVELPFNRMGHRLFRRS